jgi:DNA-binding transcriptional LysR family regulator
MGWAIVINSLTLDQLRMLAVVADTGSFSAAGRRLGRVQSAVSQSMQVLEERLGLIVFDRGGRTPALTDGGRAILAQARQILAQVDSLAAQAASIGAGLEPTLTVAVDSLFPNEPLVRSLQALQAQFPALPVTLFTEPVTASERRVREGSADIGLCGLPPGGPSDVVARPLTRIGMIPVAAPGHPLAKIAGPIDRETLEFHVQLILTDPGAVSDQRSFGVIGPRIWRFVDLSRRKDFLKAGFGWGNMPAHMVGHEIQSGKLVRLTLTEPNLVPALIPMNAVHLRLRPPGPAGRWLVEQLVAACREATADQTDEIL